jgi:glutaredoxin
MIKVFSVKSCGYCDKLKNLLRDNNIDFTDLDLDDDNNKIEIEKISKTVSLDYVPVIIVGKTILLPETSFTSIDQAYSIINKLLNNT